MENLTDEEVVNLIYNNQTRLNTMLDAVVTAVNGDNTVDLSTNLKGQSIALHSVPLYQFNTIHVSIEYAISVGTQGAVLFFQRDVERKANRMHSLQDGFFIPAFAKTSTVATGIKIQLTETEAKIEKDSKSILIDDNGIKLDTGSVTLELSDKIVVKGDLEVQGKITATDNIESSADVKAGSVSLKDHTHTGFGKLGVIVTPGTLPIPVIDSPTSTPVTIDVGKPT